MKKLPSAKIFLLLLLWGALLPKAANAYIEPGMAAMLWQAVLASLLGAVVFIRRIRLWFSWAVAWLSRASSQKSQGDAMHGGKPREAP